MRVAADEHEVHWESSLFQYSCSCTYTDHTIYHLMYSMARHVIFQNLQPHSEHKSIVGFHDFREIRPSLIEFVLSILEMP